METVKVWMSGKAYPKSKVIPYDKCRIASQKGSERRHPKKTAHFSQLTINSLGTSDWSLFKNTRLCCQPAAAGASTFEELKK